MGTYIKYKSEDIIAAVEGSTTYSEVMRRLGMKTTSGGSYNHIINRIKGLNIDTSHILGRRANTSRHIAGMNKVSAEGILSYKDNDRREHAHRLRRALIEIGIPYVCDICKIGVWKGKDVTLEIDHIDGDYKNNNRENLRFLCPNCHSQTDTYGFKGRRQ